MQEVTRANILSELKKPIQGDGNYTIGSLMRSFEITEGDIRGRRKLLCKEVYSMIEDGLIAVPERDRAGMEKDLQEHGDIFMFMQSSFNIASLRVSSEGDLLLNQQNMNRELQNVRQSVDNLTIANQTSENKIKEAINTLDKRSLAIGITIIILTAIG